MSCPDIWNINDLLEWSLMAKKIMPGLSCKWFCISTVPIDTLKKTLKLKAEEAAKEKEKQPTAETSAEKLRKILKEEKR